MRFPPPLLPPPPPPPPPRPYYSGRRHGRVLGQPATLAPKTLSDTSSIYEPPQSPSYVRMPTRPARTAYRGYSEAEVVGILRSLEDGRRVPGVGPESFKSSEDGRHSQSSFKPTAWRISLPLGQDAMDQPTEKELEPKLRRRGCGSTNQWIFALSLGINIAALVILVVLTLLGIYRLTYQAAMMGFMINLFVIHFVRNEHVFNAPFHLFGQRPQKIPFRVRYLFAKFYSLRGFHSGCGISAAMWYTAYLIFLTVEYRRRDLNLGLTPMRSHVYFVSYSILLMLFTILIFTAPRIRRATKEWFQLIHRFTGLTIILLLWIQRLLVAYDDRSNDETYAEALIYSPSFWILVSVNFLLIYPWLLMRRRPVKAEFLSDHCVRFNFDYRELQYGQHIRISDAPLKNSYSFAVIPNPKKPADPPPIEIMPTMLSRSNTNITSRSNPCPYTNTPNTQKVTPVSSIYKSAEDDAVRSNSSNSSSSSGGGGGGGGSSTIESLQSAARDRAVARRYHQHQLQQLSPPRLSNAGEPGFSVVTVSAAGEWSRRVMASPPSQLYTVGAPRFGMARIAGMFEPVIIVATGCGIVPCLALFAERPDHPARVIWAASEPLETFGSGVIETVLRADPDAIIWDTQRQGRPDLVKLARKAWIDSAKEDVAGPGQRIVPVRKAMGQCEAVIVVSNRSTTEEVVQELESRGVPALGSTFDLES